MLVGLQPAQLPEKEQPQDLTAAERKQGKGRNGKGEMAWLWVTAWSLLC